MDVDARAQFFDLKTTYQFQTTPGVDQYNMPLYSVQTEPGGQTIGMYPVYQGFTGNALINGIPVSFQTQRDIFFGTWLNVVQYGAATVLGDGTSGPYTINFPITPNTTNSPNPPYSAVLRGHVDISGIIALGNMGLGNLDPPVVTSLTAQTSIPGVAVTSVKSSVFITSIDGTGANVVVADSGQFLSGNVNYGLLMNTGKAPNGNASLGTYSTTENTVNYLTGVANVTFPVAIPAGMNINAQFYFFQTGLPRAVLFYNNTLTLRAPPSSQFLVEIDAFLSPAAFLNTENAIPFGYMAEYIARGAARKILSDTGDIEQFNFYEPLFREQELLVWKRSARQWTSTRTQTLYSMGNPLMWGNSGNLGGTAL
jgi:hypothetical protein